MGWSRQRLWPSSCAIVSGRAGGDPRNFGNPKVFSAMASPLLQIQPKPYSTPPSASVGGLRVVTKNMLITFGGQPKGWFGKLGFGVPDGGPKVGLPSEICF